MKKEQWVIFLAFLSGCLLTNFFGTELLTTYGIFNDYFLNQYSYQAVDGNRLLCHVFLERGKAAVIIFLLGRVIPGNLFAVLVKSTAAATGGFLLTVAVLNLGLRGIFICVGGLFPQWLFYFAALFYYAESKKERVYEFEGTYYRSGDKNASKSLLRGTLILLGLAAGMLLECYINPILLHFVINMSLH